MAGGSSTVVCRIGLIFELHLWLLTRYLFVVNCILCAGEMFYSKWICNWIFSPRWTNTLNTCYSS